MENLIYWMVAGGLFGFVRAWKKTAASTARAKEILDSIPKLDKESRARAIGYNRGLRFSALLISTIVGIILGAVIWSFFSLLAWLLGA